MKPDLFPKEKLRVQEKGASPTSVSPETDAGSSLGDIVETNAGSSLGDIVETNAGSSLGDIVETNAGSSLGDIVETNAGSSLGDIVETNAGSSLGDIVETNAGSSLGDIVETNASAETARIRNETVLVVSQQLIIAITVSGFFGLIVYVIYCAAVRPTLDEKGSDQELETSDVDQHNEIETIFKERLRQANSDRDGVCTEMETYTLLQE
ncbi:unnamed protein product [Acanthosepion pharaonis]|uniref:Uncharacterized protein n=1 Tax=Acanthosepion pharaonis TaxID=158019 RepID=A0A812EI49_ACAPH|nr:unnamed protein product [Sepia pharaonis]